MFNRIKEYYPIYLKAHQNIWNRRLHLLGNFFTLAFIACVVYYEVWFLLLASPFIVYFFAWPGHFFFEKNKPATLSVNPLLTKVCDWIMCYQIITGKLWI